MHYPDRSTVVREHPGRLRHGVRVLRHRPGRLRAPPHRRRDRRAGGAGGPRAADGRRRGGCRTSCSWAWASRWPTTTACGRRSERIHGDLGLSARHLTVSTVGIVPGIRRMAAEDLPVNLAVSLHAANDELRDELVPINRRYPLDDARRRLRRLPGGEEPAPVVRVGADRRRERPALRRRRAGRRSPAACRAHVNLIPLNPTPGWPTTRLAARAGRGLPRPAARPRRERHGPAEPGQRHRRRLRSAPGQPRGHAGGTDGGERPQVSGRSPAPSAPAPRRDRPGSRRARPRRPPPGPPRPRPPRRPTAP